MTNFTKLSGLIPLFFIAGLPTIGVTAVDANNSGLVEDSFVSILAEKVGVEQGELEPTMDKAANQPRSSDEIPIAYNYLEILVADLGLEVERLKSLPVDTKTEAIDKLVSDGELSEELAASMGEHKRVTGPDPRMVEVADSHPRRVMEISGRVNATEKTPLEGLAIGAKTDPKDEETRTNT